MKVSELLTKEEIREWSRLSDWKAIKVVAITWASIAAVFAMVAIWTNPFTIALAILLLGGRQLALAVITHECGHNTMFTRRWVNDFVGEWLAAAFICSNEEKYSASHLKHHRLGGTEEDPDLQNYVNYAVTRKSFRRKLLRDITGLTGIKLFTMSAVGYGPKAVAHWVVAQLVLFSVLFAFGQGWLYLLWPAAWMTSYMVIIRLRNAAEHAVVPNQFDPDPRLHTRTTIPYIWERPFLAPNHVNYHIEHHILASVPSYRLAGFHRFLKDKGLLENACIDKGYINVIKQLILPKGVDGKPYIEVTSPNDREVTI